MGNGRGRSEKRTCLRVCVRLWSVCGSAFLVVLVAIAVQLSYNSSCSADADCSAPKGWEGASCAQQRCFAVREEARCKDQVNGHKLGDTTWCWDGREVTDGHLTLRRYIRDGTSVLLKLIGERYILALPVILRMRLFPSNVEAQIQGCAMFSQLGWNVPSSKEVMLNLGAIDAGVAALKYHQNVRSVERACYDGIAALSLYNRPVSLRIGELGGVEMTVDYWRRDPDDPSRVVANYLGCYQDYSPENRERMGKAGAIELMFDACGEGGRHFWNPQAQFLVWCGFSSFHTKENHAEFRRLGGMRHTYVVFRDHGESYRVREEILQATKGFCAWKVNREDLVKEGFFELLAGAVRNETKDPQIQALGLESLRTFVDENATLRTRLAEEGGVAMALRALEIHAAQLLDTRADWDSQNVYGSLNDDQYNVPGAATEILYSIAKQPDLRKAMIEANVIQGIVSAIRGTSSRVASVRFRTLRGGCQALRLLRSEAPEEAKGAMERSGCLDREEHVPWSVNTEDGTYEP